MAPVRDMEANDLAAQQLQVRRQRKHLDLAEAEFHAAADAWLAVGHPEDGDGETFYALKHASVWLARVSATYQNSAERADEILARLWAHTEGHH